ncbi:MAG: hypothetical protein ABFR89_02540 [Actinomycetota bacterium]
MTRPSKRPNQSAEIPENEAGDQNDRWFPYANGKPTPRNLGWWDMTPMQRYTAYVSTYWQTAEFLSQGAPDQVTDEMLVVLMAASLDKPAEQAALTLMEEAGPTKDALAMRGLHDTVYGYGRFHPPIEEYAYLDLPKINTAEPAWAHETMIDTFERQGVTGSSQDFYTRKPAIVQLMWNMAGKAEEVGKWLDSKIGVREDPDAPGGFGFSTEPTAVDVLTTQQELARGPGEDEWDQWFGNTMDIVSPAVGDAILAGYLSSGIIGGTGQIVGFGSRQASKLFGTFGQPTPEVVNRGLMHSIRNANKFANGLSRFRDVPRMVLGGSLAYAGAQATQNRLAVEFGDTQIPLGSERMSEEERAALEWAQVTGAQQQQAPPETQAMGAGGGTERIV